MTNSMIKLLKVQFFSKITIFDENVTSPDCSDILFLRLGIAVARKRYSGKREMLLKHPVKIKILTPL